MTGVPSLLSCLCSSAWKIWLAERGRKERKKKKRARREEKEREKRIRKGRGREYEKEKVDRKIRKKIN